jgi:hypothetical protein
MDNRTSFYKLTIPTSGFYWTRCLSYGSLLGTLITLQAGKVNTYCSVTDTRLESLRSCRVGHQW